MRDKSRTRKRTEVQQKPEPKPKSKRLWHALGAISAMVLTTFVIYSPALQGPFVFDDRSLRYSKPLLVEQSLFYWVYSLRPMLFFNFWLNHVILGDRPEAYHIGNVIIHILNCALAFLIGYKLLTLYRPLITPLNRQLLAGLAAGIFLLHPLQTESVAYIASRSETLCAFFMLSALALFVYRLPGRVNWPTSIAILALFLTACATKEHAVALIPILLLIDFCWNAELSLSGIRKNWRVYMPLAVMGMVAGAVAFSILARSLSAGFGLRDLTWYQYFLTECRVIFGYIRLFLVPIGLSLDHDVPISKNVMDHGALFGFIGILAILALSIYFMRRYRLACFGALLFLILLAPTSSFVPVKDPLVEHRLYLPVLALALILLEPLLHTRIRSTHIAAAGLALLTIYGIASYRRNLLWGNSVELWSDAVRKAPDKTRPYAQLAIEYVAEHRCNEALNLLQHASERVKSDANLLTIWGKTDECLKRYDEAEQKLSRAAKDVPAALVYLELGVVQAKQGKAQEAFDAFSRAIQLDPSEKVSYIYRGRWYEAAGQYELAALDYKKALELNPNNKMLRGLLDNLQSRLQFNGVARQPGSPLLADPAQGILEK